MKDNTNLIYEGFANHQYKYEYAGGILYLYSDKLIFKSHSINMNVHTTIIYLSDIKDIVEFNSLFIVPNGLRIVSKDSTDKFVVNQRDKWIELINKQIEVFSKSSLIAQEKHTNEFATETDSFVELSKEDKLKEKITAKGDNLTSSTKISYPNTTMGRKVDF